MRIVEDVGALLLEKPVRTLVVADLHLGFEEELRGKGVKVPLHSPKIITELTAAAEKNKAQRIIVVGDLKHEVRGLSKLEYRLFPQILKPLREAVNEILVLPGNHDGKVRKILGDLATVLPARGMVVLEEKTGLTHGHVKPNQQVLKMDVVVTGHLHPVLSVGAGASSVRMGVWLRLRGDRRKAYQALFGEAEKDVGGELVLLIMPSFNKFMQGRSVTELSETSLLRGPLLRTGAFNIAEAEVISLDGTLLGTLEELRDVGT